MPNPLSVRQVDDLIGFIACTQSSFGTGRGMWCGCAGDYARRKIQWEGFESSISANRFGRAKLAAAGRVMSGEVRFMNARPAILPPDEKFDAILCVGSSQAIGTPAEAFSWCRDRLAPGGTLLFADLTWRRGPEPAFLEFLGVTESLHWPDEREVSVFTDAGLRILQVKRASPLAEDMKRQCMKDVASLRRSWSRKKAL